MTNRSPHIRVTFKESYSKLVKMFAQKYCRVSDAKEAIEADAGVWLNAHNRLDPHGRAHRKGVGGKWVNPDTEDYYEAKGKDGETCIWQCFS